ncbi:tectonin domain-containing protein [Spirosoma validum]|uniref:Photosynthesis system II assembly factor Ycf48/Hcf136-like domain-containing protein n=1 Tax=Spirosoma validum TaxID=2771355 RepID=A0A927B5C3_9BACT|nr:tectonin domain-containing protein [Spirosoma validum]MBD2755684.1 hypothetical protein [Spirosoma validum]
MIVLAGTLARGGYKKEETPPTPTLSWEKFPKGLLKQISVGKSGLIWGIGTNNHVFRLNSAGTDWDEPTSTALLTQVSVASDGTAWGVNSDG